MSVEPKTESQWKSEGHTEEEIRAYSVIGLVLADPPEDTVWLRQIATEIRRNTVWTPQRRALLVEHLKAIADRLEARGG